MSTCDLAWWVFDVEFSITDYLFWIWVVRVGRSWLICHQRESDLLIRVSYHTQTAFEKQARAPDTSLSNWWQQSLIDRLLYLKDFSEKSNENSFKRLNTTNDFDEFDVVEAEDRTTQAAGIVTGITKITETTQQGIYHTFKIIKDI